MPTMTATIRPATIEDMPKVVACLWLFFLESPWKDVRPDPDPIYAGGWVLDKLVHDPKSQLFVAEHDSELVGLCGGSVIPWTMMADCPYLWEWMLWVTPEMRQSGIADELWDVLKKWAKETGATGAVRGHAKGAGPMRIREISYWEFW